MTTIVFHGAATFFTYHTLSDNARMTSFSAPRPTIAMAKPVLVQLVGALFCAAVSFALTLILAHVLGTNMFGQYIALLSLASVGLILQEGGWPALLYREQAQSQTPISGERVARAWGHVVVVTLGLMSLGLALPHSSAWVAAVICMGLVAVMNGVSSLMRGAGLFAQEALWQSAGRMVSAVTLLIALGWSGHHELSMLFGAWAAGLALVLTFWGKRWLTRPRWPWTEGLANMQGNYQQVLPFVMMSATGAWLIKGDMVLLGSTWIASLKTDDVSMYAACTRLTEAGLLMFAPFSNVLFRSLNQLQATREKAALHKLGLHSIAFALGLGSVAVGLSWWCGDALMVMLFGSPFAAAGALLPWVTCMLPLTMANLVMSQWLTALGRERLLSRMMLLSAALLTILLPWMTSRWGLQGTALAVAVAQAFLLLLSLAQVTR